MIYINQRTTFQSHTYQIAGVQFQRRHGMHVSHSRY